MIRPFVPIELSGVNKHKKTTFYLLAISFEIGRARQGDFLAARASLVKDIKNTMNFFMKVRRRTQFSKK